MATYGTERVSRDLRGSRNNLLLPSTVTLAFWQLRQNWRMLFLTYVGVVAAVVIVCTMLLYTQIIMTIGLHNLLNSFLNQSNLEFQGYAAQVSTSTIQRSEQQLTLVVQNNLGNLVAGQEQRIVQTPLLSIMKQGQQSGSTTETGNEIKLSGYALNRANSHLKLLRGRLPASTGNTIEVALTPAVASALHVTPGSTLTVQSPLISASSAQVLNSASLTLRVVGIFQPNANDSFWHGDRLASNAVLSKGVYEGLASSSQLLANLAQVAARYPHLQFSDPVSLTWYYPLDVTRTLAFQASDILSGLQNLQVEAPGVINRPPQMQGVSIQGSTDLIAQYSQYTQTMQLPMTILTFQVAALLIFFVGLMMAMLVERQREEIALLRSRGGSDDQVVGALVLQSVLLGLCALVSGLLLTLISVSITARLLLTTGEQNAFNIIWTQASNLLFNVRWYMLAIVAAAILVMILSIYTATNPDIVTLRREQAREARKPLWQRLYLDIFAAVIALSAALTALYITSVPLLDPQVQVLISGPISLIAPLFLLIAFLLLFLRLFPLLLRAGARLAARGKGPLSMLALAQLSRSSRHALRLTLLLALAMASLVLTQVLAASETQRAYDVAAFQTGADFSGLLTTTINVPPRQNEPAPDYAVRDLEKVSASYQTLPGVLSVTPGYSGILATPEDNLNVDLFAVDADTYANTAVWPAQSSAQSLTALMSALRAHRDDANFHGILPAIVDATLAQKLHLTPGQQFTLYDSGAPVPLLDVAHVQSIPGITDSPGISDTLNNIPAGGLLVDFESYSSLYQDVAGNPYFTPTSELYLPVNYLWLKTSNNAVALARIRQELHNGNKRLPGLNPLFDRRATIDNLQQNSAQHILVNLLAIGALVPFLLVLVGNLIASWLSVRSRLTTFALLRALGFDQPRIAAILSIEQGIIYLAALTLGLLLGYGLSQLAVPHLIFTDAGIGGSNSLSFFLAQRVPAPAIVVPGSLILSLAIFLALCLLILALMIYLASRPSIGQTLRLNQD
ncbi:MAG TPA: ABC transporter permease [Ktedonobacteraceae bacterium]|nr:ABC transporter permease [Ktedonobacteraceae bacterium]